MAIITSKFGRLGADPLRVPRPASMSSGQQASFQSLLERAAPPPPPEPVRAPQPEPETARTEPEAKPTPDCRPPREVEAAVSATAPTGAEPAATVVPIEVQSQEPFSRGEPVRQETAGKGADSPRTFSPRGTEGDVPSTTASRDATAVVATPALPVAAVGAEVTAAAPREVAPALRGVGGLAGNLRAAVRAETVTAGYRTSGAASAQMLEQARDSVFKQILVQLQDGGGELRVRLQPPELGELDLRLVVTEGNKLSLRIAAERADLAELLQQHLGELEQALQSAGLQITDAEVQTRDERGAHELPFAAGMSGAGADVDDAPVAAPAVRRGGILRGDGLDFWV